MKDSVKNILRPFVRKFKRLFEPKPFIWFESTPNWQVAKSRAVGYDAENILERCKTSLIKVRDGVAKYERDSVLFDEIQYSWGLLAALQKASIENNNELCVLDFGGSLGSSYFQNREFLAGLKNLKWCIVEQEHFVESGKENFENDQLKFYYTIEDCLKENQPNVLLLSSVLQYLDEPHDWIEKLIKYDFPYVIIDRTAFIESDSDVASLQHIPPYIYAASYPGWFFEKGRFTKHFDQKYTILGYFDSGYTPSGLLDKKKIYWDGLILKKNEIS